MTTPLEAAQDLYLQLKPEAVTTAREYIMARTPADLTDEMTALIESDLAGAVVPEGAAIVQNGANVLVSLPAYNVGIGAAVVLNSALTKVAIPDTIVAVLGNGQTVPVVDNAGAPQPGTPAVLTIANNAVTEARLGAVA